MPNQHSPEVIVISDSTPLPHRPWPRINIDTPNSTTLQSTSPGVYIVHETNRHEAARRDLSANFENADQPDEDITVVGTSAGIEALVDYPHFRFQCGTKPLSKKNAKQFCDMCFCFICDTPAKQCKKWRYHASASDQSTSARRSRQITLYVRNHGPQLPVSKEVSADSNPPVPVTLRENRSRGRRKRQLQGEGGERL